jgi:hypothetical protein
MEKQKTIKAKWLKFHPSSACSAGDIEEMTEDRFNELSELEYVIKVEDKKDAKTDNQNKA